MAMVNKIISYLTKSYKNCFNYCYYVYYFVYCYLNYVLPTNISSTFTIKCCTKKQNATIAKENQ